MAVPLMPAPAGLALPRRAPVGPPQTVRWVAGGLIALLVCLAASGVLRWCAATAYTVAEAVRNGPLTLTATLWGLAHHGHLAIRGRLIVVTDMRGGYGPRSGLTVGDAMLAGVPLRRIRPALIAHEEHHAGQWAALGPVAFPIAYGCAQLAGDLWLGGGGASNVFEMAAGLPGGGYHEPARPVPRELARALGPHDRRAGRYPRPQRHDPTPNTVAAESVERGADDHPPAAADRPALG